jgi:hypothetical protein
MPTTTDENERPRKSFMQPKLLGKYPTLKNASQYVRKNGEI